VLRPAKGKDDSYVLFEDEDAFDDWLNEYNDEDYRPDDNYNPYADED
jgi:hypothetical protein